METGVYDQPLPAWRPIDFGAFARDMAQKQAYVHDEGVVDVGNGMVSQESWNMPSGTEGRFLVGLLGQNPQADVDFFSRWDKADKERYFKLADANKDNKTSPDEEKNAIALWAKDEFGDVRTSKRTTPKGKPRPISVTGFNSKLPVSSSNNQNDKYDLQGETPINTLGGRIIAPDFMPIATKNPASVFLTIGKYYESDDKGNVRAVKQLDNSESVSVEVLGYSPAKDMIFVKSIGSGDYIGKEDILALNAGEYDNYLKKNFGIDRESLKKKPQAKQTKGRPY